MITKEQIPDYAPAEIELPNGWTAKIETEWEEGELDCHPDCGPVVRSDSAGMHMHENEDGRCWHGDAFRVSVTLVDAAGERVGHSAVGGFESDVANGDPEYSGDARDYWREVAAGLVNELAAGLVMPNITSEIAATTEVSNAQ
jgi:hypothetical protein